jgi:hypothetical protein
VPAVDAMPYSTECSTAARVGRQRRSVLYHAVDSEPVHTVELYFLTVTVTVTAVTAVAAALCSSTATAAAAAAVQL